MEISVDESGPLRYKPPLGTGFMEPFFDAISRVQAMALDYSPGGAIG
jgi:hypothetical protein